MNRETNRTIIYATAISAISIGGGLHFQSIALGLLTFGILMLLGMS